MYELIPVFLVSFLVTFVSTPWIIPKLRRAGLVGRDMNKKDEPRIPEMGGFAVIFGLSSGVLLAIGLATFSGEISVLTGVSFLSGIEFKFILAALLTILIMAIIGIFDDLFAMHQVVKAALPLFAALPLVAVKAGETTMLIPFLGPVPFGILYTLILIPVGVAGASNVTNMLAGFNGLEAGMGAVACFSLAAIALLLPQGEGRIEAAVVLISVGAALLAFLYYNWYPAKVLIGDIGTLSIGAAISASVIIGNFEMAGVIIIIPYALDFFIKARNRFPSRDWWGRWDDGKLYCGKRPVSFCQWIMKASNGIRERNLVVAMVFLEAVSGVIAILLMV